MTMLVLASGGILDFNPGFAIWELVTLVVFIGIMSRYAVPILMDALEERESRIKESLETAENALEKAEQISKDNEKAMRKAEKKAQKIRKEAIEEAEKVREERIKKSKNEAEQIIEDARNTIEQEKKLAMQELRDEVAKLAVKSASKIIDSELDEQKNSKLVDQFIDDLSKN